MFEFVRFAERTQVLTQKRQEFGNKMRCIVFVQQRVTAHILEHFVGTDADLRELGAACIYSTSSPATPRLKVTSSEARERIDRFRDGRVAVLFATSVAEEGMDIPASNVVVRFDPVQTPVSLVQSKGRARQQNSAFVVMRVRLLMQQVVASVLPH